MVTIYFSGTGNTKYVANRFSSIMGCQNYSIEDNVNFKDVFKINNTICFCYPVYGSCVPKIMREFIQKHKTCLDNKEIIIFCTQLMFSGDGARVFTDLLKGNKYKVIYAEHFNMPNNISNTSIFKVTNGNENHKVVDKVNKKLIRVCYNIKNDIIYKKGFNIFSYLLGLLQRPFFIRYENKLIRTLEISNECNNCKLCINICPTKNLYLKDNKIQDKNKCTLCYRCVNICPQKAIRLMFDKPVIKQYKGIDLK